MNDLRPSFCLAIALCLIGTVVGGEGEQAKRPNVILVITDDQGYGDLACHGNKVIKTPNLDALYSRSTRLTNFHVNPICAPTRAALMTGRYANATGVWHTFMGRSILRDDEATMAQVFSDAGYATGMFGKWHLGDNLSARPEDVGFQHVVRHGGGGVGQLPDVWGNDYFDDTYWENGKKKKFDGYCTDIWFGEALKFIESKKGGEAPFFVYLSTNAPHRPFFVPEKYTRMYAGNPDVPNAAFYGMITNIDENIGRLVAKLEEWALTENTIVIFMTDNGTEAGYEEDGEGRPTRGFNAGMRGTKGSEYDGGHRVPFFICWPGGGVTAGRDIPTLTAHIDVLPTLMEYCGITKRPEGAPLMQGKSLVPLLSGDVQRWEPRTLVTDSQQVDVPIKWKQSAVMTDRWRLINGKELYDISVDAGQKLDVAKEQAEVVATLLGEYEKWWATVSSRFDETCNIIVGDDRENPTRLTGHDWHGDKVPWDQQMVKDGELANGSWAIDVAVAGKYEITLTRWPIELGVPINASVPGGKAIVAKKALLLVGSGELSKGIPEDALSVRFETELAKGKQRLQTWLVDGSGDETNQRGAYFVYVKRL